MTVLVVPPLTFSTSVLTPAAVWALEAWGTEALPGILAARFPKTVSDIVVTWGAGKGTSVSHKAQGTMALSSHGVTGGTMLALTHADAVHPIESSWA
ncbi:hypothetical protein Hamer_G006883, partial [Homarus americanus]